LRLSMHSTGAALRWCVAFAVLNQLADALFDSVVILASLAAASFLVSGGFLTESIAGAIQAWHEIVEPDPEKEAGKRKRIIRLVLRSYFLAIFSYAFDYKLFSYLDGAFNIPTLDMSSAIYFSVVTITTTGYGDIAAVHPLVRLWVASEIIFGIMVAVFLFGLIANVVQKPR
jgi:hypothetical protein